MNRYLPSKITLWLSLVLSSMFSVLILSMALDHEFHEFYDPISGVDWIYSIQFGAIGFLWAFVCVFPISYLIDILARIHGHSSKDNGPAQNGCSSDKTE
jgi:hypothetical protein